MFCCVVVCCCLVGDVLFGLVGLCWLVLRCCLRLAWIVGSLVVGVLFFFFGDVVCCVVVWCGVVWGVVLMRCVMSWHVLWCVLVPVLLSSAKFGV